MSLTPAGRSADRSLELVRRSLLQGDGLPFQDALTVEQMRQALDAEGVAFGDTNDDHRQDHQRRDGSAGATDDRGIVYARGVTLIRSSMSQRRMPTRIGDGNAGR